MLTWVVVNKTFDDELIKVAHCQFFIVNLKSFRQNGLNLNNFLLSYDPNFFLNLHGFLLKTLHFRYIALEVHENIGFFFSLSFF
jgi:hypothetical protein